jgi:xylose isomerase
MPTKFDKRYKFTFGLWTSEPGPGPVRRPTREPISPAQVATARRRRGVRRQLPRQRPDPDRRHAAEAERIKRDFKKALKDNGLVVPMATTNLFCDPVFKDGAFTSNNAQIRATRSRRRCAAMDLGPSSGAKIYVFWGGREGAESDATKNPVEAVKRFREAITSWPSIRIEQRYGYRFAFEAKPNEPRGHMYFAVTGRTWR